jgi:hypothetical protein
VDCWGREDARVAAVVEEFEALPGCEGVRVQMAGPVRGDGSVELFVSASMEVAGDEAYVKPHRTVLIEGGDALADRVRFVAGLDGPPSFLQAECSERTEALVSSGAHLSAYQEELLPLLLPSILRTQTGGPRRRETLRALSDDGLPYRNPRGSSPLFTDMRPDELRRVVNEAAHLACAAHAMPNELLPLLPAEVHRIRNPPSTRTTPSDYNDRLAEIAKYPDAVRSYAILATDLVLLRLGRDPDDEQARAPLRVTLNRRLHERHK